jgi:tetratricopeptide (TPR) repeat protein
MWATVRSLPRHFEPASLLAALLLAGCAASPEPFVQLSGSSGPVSWEIVDVSQTSVPGEQIHWAYTLILRSDASAIQFETFETGTAGGGVGLHVSPFTERLEARGRLLINSSYTLLRNKMSSNTFGNSALGQLEAVRLFHRLSGRDQNGRLVRVDVRFTLHAGLGAGGAAPPSQTGSQRGTRESVASGSAPFANQALAHERIKADPTPLERALLDDLRDRSLEHHSPLDAALIVSGARDAQELDDLRRRFDQATAPIVARVSRLALAERAPALLGALHPARTSQAPLLREYVVNATTLVDVIETGRYNCVSATIVFTLLAARVGLDANPVLVPSHARAAVRIGDKRVPVEATAPYGFNPSEAERREILRRFRADVDGAPSYRNEGAVDVDFLAILGAVYTNVSTYRNRDRDTNTAAAVARRADVFVAPSERRLLNRVRIGLLNEMAVDRSKQGRHDEAVRALKEASRLAREQDDASFLAENFTAVAVVWLREVERSADDTALLAFSDRFADVTPIHGEVRSFALRLLAHRRIQEAQWERALANLREAEPLTQNAEYRGQIARDAADVELRHVDDLASRDVEAAWKAFQALPPGAGDAKVAELHRHVRHRLVVARIRQLDDQGRCEELAGPLALWRDLDTKSDPDGAHAGCHGRRGVDRWNSGQLDQATDDFRLAYHLAPRAPTMEQNLVGALQRLAGDHVERGRCENARPLIAEGLALAPRDPWFQWAAATCKP